MLYLWFLNLCMLYLWFLNLCMLCLWFSILCMLGVWEDFDDCGVEFEPPEDNTEPDYVDNEVSTILCVHLQSIISILLKFLLFVI